MPAFTWWIDEPLVRSSSNPSDEDLRRFRAQGFSLAVSLLEENKQPPRYDKKSAADAGWSIYSIPIEERCAPSLDQILDFTARLTASPQGTKVRVLREWQRPDSVHGRCLLGEQGPLVQRFDYPHKWGVLSD